jgi:hypothetical protein
MMYDPYNDPVGNPDDPYNREWGSGSMVAGIVAIVIMAGIIAYGASRTNTAIGPSSTISQPNTTGSQPNTTGQGGGLAR